MPFPAGAAATSPRCPVFGAFLPSRQGHQIDRQRLQRQLYRQQLCQQQPFSCIRCSFLSAAAFAAAALFAQPRFFSSGSFLLQQLQLLLFSQHQQPGLWLLGSLRLSWLQHLRLSSRHPASSFFFAAAAASAAAFFSASAAFLAASSVGFLLCICGSFLRRFFAPSPGVSLDLPEHQLELWRLLWLSPPLLQLASVAPALL